MTTTNATIDHTTREVEILDNFMARKIEEGQRNAKAALDKIESEGQLLRDMIAPLGGKVNGTRPLSFTTWADGVHRSSDGLDLSGKLAVDLSGNLYSLHPHAAEQAAMKLRSDTSLSPAYIRELAGHSEPWAPRLAAEILNQHSQHTSRQRVLVREVGGQIRGILSDQYRRLDSGPIFSAFIQGLKKQDGLIVNAHADDTKSWIEGPIPTPLTIPTRRNGQIRGLFGARIWSSDFGDSALGMAFYFTEIRCWNGMVGESIMREVHLGRRLPDDMRLSDRTYRLDTQAMASLTSDMIGNLLSREAIEKRARAIQAAAENEVDLDAQIKTLVKKGLQKGEVEEVKGLLVAARPSDGVEGGPTMWKLSSAITAMAREKEGRRRREIEELAGALVLNN